MFLFISCLGEEIWGNTMSDIKSVFDPELGIVIIGQEMLVQKEVELVLMGGNSAGKTSAEMMPLKCRVPFGTSYAIDYSIAPETERLVGVIMFLRRQIDSNLDLIVDAKHQQLDKWNRIVIEAFLGKRKCYPPTYEYGKNFGNFRTELITDGTTLYRTKPVRGSEYGHSLEPIAVRRK